MVNYWIVEIYIVSNSKEHTDERNRLNQDFIGQLGAEDQQERSPRGVKRPSWFQDLTMDDIDQMARVMPMRRRAQ